jgi:hypothetical protein
LGVLEQLDADAAGALEHFLDFNGQIKLAVACDGQAGCVGFAGGQILDPGGHGLFVFRGDALLDRQLALGFRDQDLFLVTVFIDFPLGSGLRYCSYCKRPQ